MNPTIDPKWRTATVLELCISMRELQDFYALPILADALQDADCADEKLLARLRAASDYAESTRLVALVMRADAADSVKWVEQFGASLNDRSDDPDDDRMPSGVSYGSLIRAAKDRLEHGDYYCLPFITPDQAYEGSSELREFWRHYQIITGARVADEDAGFFRCAC